MGRSSQVAADVRRRISRRLSPSLRRGLRLWKLAAAKDEIAKLYERWQELEAIKAESEKR